jgi:MFS family permease
MDPRASVPDSRAAWIAASAALAILTVCYGAPLISVVALKPIAADLGTSRGAPSAAGAFTYIGAAFGGIAAGWLAGRFGVRAIVLFGAVMVTAGLFVSALGGLPELYVGHGLLMGLFGTACMLSPLVTYVSLWFERHRGAAVALISSGQSIAGALWPTLIDIGISQLGWRQTMQLFGIFVLVAVTLLAVVFLHAPPQSQSMQGGGKAQANADGKVIGLPPNLAMAFLMIAVFCCCVPMNMPMQHIVAFCGDLGISSQRGAAMLSVLLGSAFLARQFWGWVADKVGGVTTLLIGATLQCIALVFYLIDDGLTSLYIASALFGLFQGGIVPSYAIIVREYFPPSEAATRVSLAISSTLIGMALGGWMGGVLFDWTGSYRAAFLNGIAWNVMTALLAWWLLMRQTRRAAAA